jgi:hypothetical protein
MHQIENINKELEMIKKPRNSGIEKYNNCNENFTLETSIVDLKT